MAVSICQHHGLGQNGLSDVYKRWADFLYAKGEHMEAAQKYIQVKFGISRVNSEKMSISVTYPETSS